MYPAHTYACRNPLCNRGLLKPSPPNSSLHRLLLSSGQVDLGTEEVGHTVVSGLRHACAIVTGGRVKCWGDNRSGQLGLGHVATMGDDADELGDNLPFVDLGSGATATSLSLGESHSCALLGDGTVR